MSRSIYLQISVSVRPRTSPLKYSLTFSHPPSCEVLGKNTKNALCQGPYFEACLGERNGPDADRGDVLCILTNRSQQPHFFLAVGGLAAVSQRERARLESPEALHQPGEQRRVTLLFVRKPFDLRR